MHQFGSQVLGVIESSERAIARVGVAVIALT